MIRITGILQAVIPADIKKLTALRTIQHFRHAHERGLVGVIQTAGFSHSPVITQRLALVQRLIEFGKNIHAPVIQPMQLRTVRKVFALQKDLDLFNKPVSLIHLFAFQLPRSRYLPQDQLRSGCPSV